MVENKKQFNSGDFAFAKVKGHPPWPVIISKYKNDKFNVYFYGTGETASLKEKYLFEFMENKKRFATANRMKRKDYCEAMHQIEEAVLSGEDTRHIIETDDIDDDVDASQAEEDTSAEHYFNIGDYVFAQVKGYLPWPAKITECDKKMYMVYFYGTGKRSHIKIEDLFPYKEYKEKFSTETNLEYSSFHQAMDQIEAELNGKDSGHIDLPVIANVATEHVDVDAEVVENKEFIIGDLVFAKVKGYPAWPAIITECNNKKFNVYFYGTEERGSIKAENLFQYIKNKTKLATANRMKRKDFREAMDQVEAALNVEHSVRIERLNI